MEIIEAQSEVEAPEIEMPRQPQMLSAEKPEQPCSPPLTPRCAQPIQVAAAKSEQIDQSYASRIAATPVTNCRPFCRRIVRHLRRERP